MNDCARCLDKIDGPRPPCKGSVERGLLKKFRGLCVPISTPNSISKLKSEAFRQKQHVVFSAVFSRCQGQEQRRHG